MISVTSRTHQSLPEGFIHLSDIAPDIIQEIRYAGFHNFVGRPVAGYVASRAILTVAAAKALAAAQQEFVSMGFRLKIYDGYRPQKAVDDFAQWAQDPADQLMKAEFYPKIDKATLFDEGYLAHRSSHSRGSAVDVTLVPLHPSPQPVYRSGERLVSGTAPQGVRFRDNSIDMGTGFDTFDELANTFHPQVGRVAMLNRRMLCRVMDRHGFANYHKEWWHFALTHEPFTKGFDFDVG